MSHYSGLIGVPKSEINRHLVSKFMPISVLVEQKMSLENFLAFLKKYKLSFPIICKPNAGERSTGVYFIQNGSELSQFIATAPDEPFLVQEFLGQKKEFGIVMVRKSVSSNEFSVFSCVEKQARRVIGDGKSTIQALVEQLPIAVAQRQKILLSLSEDEKQTVLPVNEERKIARMASVSLGTVFVNRQDEVTPALEKSLSAALVNYQGFNVGRFDIMADSLADIEKENYKIIELNGVGATPLTIYELDRSVESVYEQLENYYDLLLEWGRKNASKKRLSIVDYWHFLRSVYPAVKQQKTSDLVRKLEKQNFKILFYNWWKFEKNGRRNGRENS